MRWREELDEITHEESDFFFEIIVVRYRIKNSANALDI
jgi:hypothetical protein